MTNLAKIIGFFSGKGGVGKSHICAATGLALAAQKKSVLWIDMDLGWRNLDFILKANRDIVFDLNHILQGACHWREALINIPSCTHCHLIAGTLSSATLPSTPHVIKEILSQAKNSYDYILIDLGSGFDESHELILSLCDIPIIISTTDQSSLRCIDKILTVVPKNKHPLWILNQFPIHLDPLQKYSKEMNYPISLSIPVIEKSPSFWDLILGRTSLMHENLLTYIKPWIKTIVKKEVYDTLD